MRSQIHLFIHSQNSLNIKCIHIFELFVYFDLFFVRFFMKFRLLCLHRHFQFYELNDVENDCDFIDHLSIDLN